MKRSLNHSGDELKDQGEERERLRGSERGSERRGREESRKERGVVGRYINVTCQSSIKSFFFKKYVFSTEIPVPGNCQTCFSAT